MPYYTGVPSAVRYGAMAAKTGVTIAASYLPSGVAALYAGTKPLGMVLGELAPPIVKDEVQKQLYDQTYLRGNPPPYAVAIARESDSIRAELLQVIDDQGEIKKKVILLEVDEKIAAASKKNKTELKDLIKQKAKADLAAVEKRIAELEREVKTKANLAAVEQRITQLELEVKSKAATSETGTADHREMRNISKVVEAINKSLSRVEGRLTRLEELPRPHPPRATAAATDRCCRHCKELSLVQADLKALYKRLWSPEAGALNLDNMHQFCWVAVQEFKKYEEKVKEYDSKLAGPNAMAAAPTAAPEQPRENPPRGCDHKAIDSLTTQVRSLDERIKDIDSRLPQYMREYCESLKLQVIRDLSQHIAAVDAELIDHGKKIAALEKKKKGDGESVAALVSEAVEEAKAAADGKFDAFKEYIMKQAEAAIAAKDKRINELKAASDKEVDAIKQRMKEQADAAAAKDKKIEELEADNEKLNNGQAALNEKLEAQDQELREQRQKFADEQAVKNQQIEDIWAFLRRGNGSGQDFPPGPGPDQQQPPPPPPQGQAPPAPQGNDPPTPSPSPPHHGSHDDQGSHDDDQGKQGSPDPVDVEDEEVDAGGADIDAETTHIDDGDSDMMEAPGSAAQPPSQPEQAGGGGGQPFFGFGQGPASSSSGPTKPEAPAPAAAPAPSIFMNVPSPDASDSKINWGAQMGNFSFADLSNLNGLAAAAQPTESDTEMTPASPALVNEPWTGQPATEVPSSGSAPSPGSVPPPPPQLIDISIPDGPSPAPAMTGNYFAPSSSSPPPAVGSSPPTQSELTNFPPMASSDFGFSMPPPPVGTNPVAFGSQVGAGFANMLMSNGQVKPIAMPGQQVNEHGNPMLKPRFNRGSSSRSSAPQTATATAAATSPVVAAAVPDAQPVRNFNAYVEDETEAETDIESEAEADVEMDMGGNEPAPAPQSAPAPEPAPSREPAPTPTPAPAFEPAPTPAPAPAPGFEILPAPQPAPAPAHPTSSEVIAVADLQRPQQLVQQQIPNTKFSLVFYEAWKASVRAKEAEHPALPKMKLNDLAKRQMNQAWHDRITFLNRGIGLTTRDILRNELRLPADAKGYSKDEMRRLMSVWLRKVFSKSMMDISTMHMDAVTPVYKTHVDGIEEWLTPEKADVA